MKIDKREKAIDAILEDVMAQIAQGRSPQEAMEGVDKKIVQRKKEIKKQEENEAWE